MNDASPHIVLAGGGTGGHLFPGLAVSEALVEMLPAARITFAGSGKPLERQCITRHAPLAVCPYQYLAVPCRPLPRRPWQALPFLSANFAGLVASRRFLRREHVSLVIGLGGYVSAPMVRAAIAEGLPTVLLEGNAVPGRATRWLSARASLVCTALAASHVHFKRHVRLHVTGMPVRREFVRAASRPKSDGNWGLPARERQLLVLGGSSGAQSLNECVPRAMYKMRDALDGWRIVHQAGAGRLRETEERYKKLGLEAAVAAFIDNPAKSVRESDLVISRAGASTLAELAVCGAPTVLVPYPAAADNHQLANARVLAAAGACRLIEPGGPGERLEERLVREVGPLLSETVTRETLSERITKFARPDAAQQVALAACQIADLPRVAPWVVAGDCRWAEMTSWPTGKIPARFPDGGGGLPAWLPTGGGGGLW